LRGAIVDGEGSVEEHHNSAGMDEGGQDLGPRLPQLHEDAVCGYCLALNQEHIGCGELRDDVGFAGRAANHRAAARCGGVRNGHMGVAHQICTGYAHKFCELNGIGLRQEDGVAEELIHVCVAGLEVVSDHNDVACGAGLAHAIAARAGIAMLAAAPAVGRIHQDVSTLSIARDLRRRASQAPCIGANPGGTGEPAAAAIGLVGLQIDAGAVAQRLWVKARGLDLWCTIGGGHVQAHARPIGCIFRRDWPFPCCLPCLRRRCRNGQDLGAYRARR